MDLTDNFKQKILQFARKFPKEYTDDQILQNIEILRTSTPSSSKQLYEQFVKTKWLKKFPTRKPPSYTSWRYIVTFKGDVEDLRETVKRRYPH